MNGVTVLENGINLGVDIQSTVVAILILLGGAVYFIASGVSGIHADTLVEKFFFSIGLICAIGGVLFFFYPIKKESDFTTEVIIAYVDTSVVTEEQLTTMYEILDVEGEIYKLKKKENKNVHNEHTHNWIVSEKDVRLTKTEYILKCEGCNQLKQVLYEY